ncbi:MAG: hypothetical protein NC201_06825 [Prevotella sp.]|nr:hypothetical protein [Bacteroides sp.]MCM1366941.1 hypothetical protein [Prevotella sp.]MCM1437175.1 hypothetical protein [Prevotella sp.]
MNLEEIKNRINLLNAPDAIQLLTDYLKDNPKDDEALTLRGMKYFGNGQRALAINDYLEAIRINPDSRANMALKAANDILDYYNKDLYNP